jgi:hypothetical protein
MEVFAQGIIVNNQAPKNFPSLQPGGCTGTVSVDFKGNDQVGIVYSGDNCGDSRTISLNTGGYYGNCSPVE